MSEQRYIRAGLRKSAQAPQLHVAAVEKLKKSRIDIQ